MAEEETTETTEETDGKDTTAEETAAEETTQTDETVEETEGEKDGKKDADYYRAQVRRLERQNKTGSQKDKKEIARLQSELKKRQEADQTEQEKAVNAAKEEGRTSALAEAQKERRADRLALAVERLSAKGVKVGDGDEQVKFRGKPALVMLERMIDSGDLDTSDLFDDKDKVRDEGLAGAITSMLEDDDWLVVKPESTKTQRAADSDAGKGGTGSKSLEEMSPDDHLKAIQASK